MSLEFTAEWMTADAMEIVSDDDLVEILLDYLEMQGRSSSDEDASDEDDWSSGNDSDFGRAISAEIVGGEGSPCCGSCVIRYGGAKIGPRTGAEEFSCPSTRREM